MSARSEMTWIILRSSWQGLRAAGAMGAVAVATIATALFMLGAFGLAVVNMEGLLDDFGKGLPGVKSFSPEILDHQANIVVGCEGFEVCI